jgi:predicted DNA-binding WGR domain protein
MTKTAVYLQHIDPTRNCRRWYAVHLQQEIWGGVAVVCQWGRIGNTGGCEKVIRCASLGDAQDTMQKILRRRTRRGYCHKSAERPNSAI